MPRSAGLAAMTALAALALVACGDEEREGSFTSEGGTGTETTGTGTTGTETTGTAPAEAPSRRLRIAEMEFKLRPAGFSISEPGVVEFVVRNTGQIAHALEVEGPTGEFETEEIAPGESARLKADVSEPGEYKLYCPIGNHDDQGMVGQLVVGSAGNAPPPSADHNDRDREAEEEGDDDTGGAEAGEGDPETGGARPGY